MSKAFMRNIFGGGLKPSDPRRFLIEAMLGAMEADGSVSDVERRTLRRNLEEHDLFAGLASEHTELLINTATEALRLAGSPLRRVGAIARGLPARTFRLTAYAMAVEVCASDSELHPNELEYLHQLRRNLVLTEHEATEIFDRVRAHNGMTALEGATRRMRELAPRYIDAMMLTATAAGVGQTERVRLVRGVSYTLLDLQVLQTKEIDDIVTLSFQRYRGKAVLEEFAALPATISHGSDRFWGAVYMVATALAAGNEEWREVGFFEIVKARFGLSDQHLDVAQQIARQLPLPRFE
jgi:uncharacterized tellurite resistance protein B-like protein